MGAPLSMDLRQRILDAYLTREGSWGELARRFRVGVATVARVIGRWQRTGSLDPKRPGPRPYFRIPDSQLGQVKRLLDAAPDSTTQEIADAYVKQTGVCVNRATMGRAFRRLGYTRKKSRSSPPSGGWRRIAEPAGGIWLRPPN